MKTTKAADTGHWDRTITSIQAGDAGWEIGIENSCCYWLRDKGVVPHVGDTIRFYGRGMFLPIRGADVNGVEVFYESEAEYRARVLREQEASDQEKRRKFQEQLPEWERRVAALPEPFRRRIAGFRERRPDWEWQHGGYELFVCEQAVAFATALGTPEAIHEFHELPYAQQQERVQELSDGHSGNTFSAACALAQAYLSQPEMVERMHGTLCPLVGCDHYGC